jgi:heat shock protein HslJ
MNMVSDATSRIPAVGVCSHDVHMSARSRRVLSALTLSAVLTIAACSPKGLASELEGRYFVAESAVGHELIEGRPITITFGDDWISADGGCNTISGSVRIDHGRLRGKGLGMTEMGCLEPDVDKQEDWYLRLLTSEPVLTWKAPRLTLASKDAKVTFVQRERPRVEP